MPLSCTETDCSALSAACRISTSWAVRASSPDAAGWKGVLEPSVKTNETLTVSSVSAFSRELVSRTTSDAASFEPICSASALLKMIVLGCSGPFCAAAALSFVERRRKGSGCTYAVAVEPLIAAPQQQLPARCRQLRRDFLEPPPVSAGVVCNSNTFRVYETDSATNPEQRLHGS